LENPILDKNKTNQQIIDELRTREEMTPEEIRAADERFEKMVKDIMAEEIGKPHKFLSLH
jgi:hypothetical protein